VYTPVGEFRACRAPLDVDGSWLVFAQVLDRERVVVAEHFQAGAALAGDDLWVFGAQAQRDAASAQRIRGGVKDACELRALRDGSHRWREAFSAPELRL
jgi:hypothetical protein